MNKEKRGAGNTGGLTPLTSRRSADGSVPRSGQSGPVNREMAALRKRLAAEKWAGPINARAVLLEVLNLGSQLYVPDGLSVRVYASRRRLSELAGLSDTATARALAWLEAQNWLARSEPGRGGALGWHLGGQFRRWVDAAGVVITRMYNSGPVEEIDSFFSTGPEMHFFSPFDGALLGHVAETIYRALTDRRQTAAALALDLNLDRRTVTGHLEKLAAVNLAEHVVKGWIKGAGTVDEAAEKLGAAAVVEGRKQKHTTERQSWHDRAAQREQREEQQAALLVSLKPKITLVWRIMALTEEMEGLGELLNEMIQEVYDLAAEFGDEYPFGICKGGTPDPAHVLAERMLSNAEREARSDAWLVRVVDERRADPRFRFRNEASPLWAQVVKQADKARARMLARAVAQ